ncbi:hypothetical protein BG28_12665 [Nesterenkonia sp. AN1]|uniref:hypothetical protein n=1 Tax=Nesterenkonia sp. AN1 TaxID=652017 RepID=UPI000450DC64|nr:hypothetical protein [Nesterenkonia sp. AN1]EXF25616.1 hypothetical protein BG28_12665 [Nesterenkonia sp. AN1]
MTTITAHAAAAEVPVHQRTSFQALAAAGLLALAALVVMAGNGALLDYATAGLTLINGPLIEGPLLNLGDTLTDLQIGQFQQ